MATIDEQRAARRALRAAQKNTAADSGDPTVGWTTQQGAQPTTPLTTGVAVAQPLAFVGGDKPDLSAPPTPEPLELEPSERDELEAHTVAELREIAAANQIDLAGATRKDEIIDAILADEDDEE